MAGVIELITGCLESCATNALSSPFCAVYFAGKKGPYALIACISGTIPTICMTRLKL